VLELVDGQTLAERLAEGPMPIDDAIRYARQIAGALEAAHEQGIVHRDLKPSNVKRRPDGTVKLLDFGLAKIVRPVVGGATAPNIVTTDSRGAVVGTAAYMSPEQARGREEDRRSDIWAFGAVLFEMLSGERAFTGRDVPDTIAVVAAGEIVWRRLPSHTPSPLRHLLTRSLERDPARRLRDIGEARIVLDDLIDGTMTPEAANTSGGRPLLTPLLGATVAAVAIGILAAALWPRPSSLPSAVTRFALTPPADRQLLVDPQSRDLSITRDGTRIIYKGGDRIDRTRLFVQHLDQLEPEPLTPTGLPKGPFVSPDGQWVGFFEPGAPGAAFKKVPLTGGPAVLVSRLDGPSRGATWVDDRTIIAASGATSTGLLRLSPSGGEPVVVTRPNRDRGEADHVWPHALPGGQHVLFTITALTGDVDAAHVGVVDLASGSWRPVLQRARQAHYVPSGHLIYVAGGALWAIAFDPVRAQTRGTARVVVPQVVTLPTGVAEFDIADDGTLVYVVGSTTSAAPRTLVWVDREGREDPIDAPAKAYVSVRLSPDGTRAAAEIEGDGHDIWVWDFTRKNLTRVTSDPGIDQSPVWMPDGRRLVFKTEAGGVLGALAMQSADGSGTAERLTEGARIERASFALADSSGIIFSDGTGPKLLRLDHDRSVSSLLVLGGRGGGAGELSPDERWMAYVAIHSDTPQVFITPFPDVKASRTLVTPAGGSEPRWARDGRALFYTGLDGTLMSVTIDPKAPIKIGPPAQVLKTAYYGGITVLSRTGTYDVAPDGRRFLMLKDVDDANAAHRTQIVVVRHWIEELKRLVPVQ
jgi:serine/threonine-protein kinase